MSTIINLPIDASSIKGFLAEDEGHELYRRARGVADLGPCLEIGSYCGKSALYLGTACKHSDNLLFCVDHHNGSEENQPGELYCDPDLIAADQSKIDSLPYIRQTLAAAKLEQNVILAVCTSNMLVKNWRTALGLVFIDGGHTFQAAEDDYANWPRFIVSGGWLLIHDLYDSEAQGGQAPITIYRKALRTGEYKEYPRIGSLGVLQKI